MTEKRMYKSFKSCSLNIQYRKSFRCGVSCAEAIPIAHSCAWSGELKCKSYRR